MKCFAQCVIKLFGCPPYITEHYLLINFKLKIVSFHIDKLREYLYHYIT